jgi:hypothetical protein
MPSSDEEEAPVRVQAPAMASAKVGFVSYGKDQKDLQGNVVPVKKTV